MNRSRLFTYLLLFSVAGVSLAADKKKPTINSASRSFKKLTPDQQKRLTKKAAKERERKPFDQPDEAMEYYALSRTGPVITRGANPTTNRPLNTAQYLPALRTIMGMPTISSATRAIAPSSANLAVSPAAAGAALGTWTNLGPANQGGRTRALLIDPNSPNTLYAGGVDGGVWKSTDGGLTWSTNTDLALTNLAVVTLAFQPGNTNVIYAGTGEGFGNADAIRGAGIFKTTDGGATWNQLASTNNTDFLYTMKVLVSPRNPQRVWAATRAGLYRSLNGGASFTQVLNASSVGGCTDMAMQERRAIGYLFVSCGRTSSQGTIYRGFDGDTSSFVSVMSLSGQGRSSIAIAPSNESIVYVLSSQRNAGGGPGQYGLHGVYRSLANGNPGSFTTQRQGNVAFASTAAKINQLLLSNPVIALLTECGFGTSSFSNQGWYDNVIAVDPLDSNKVWAGGIDLWRSDNGGVDWGTASFWWFTKGVDTQYAHADQHAIVFHPGYNGSSNKIMYVANDGGLQRTDDARAAVNTALAQLCGSPVAGSVAWTDRSNGYVTTQFYDGTAYPDGNRYFGGLQDNGTMRGTSPSLNWSVLAGGDGGYTALDTKADATDGNDVLFLENTGKSLQRSTNGGATFTNVSGTVTGSGFLFIAPFEMNQGNKNHIWYGGFDIWLSQNQGTTFSRMTGAVGTCGLGSISAFAAHPADANRVLVGMSDGCYHYNTAALTPVAGNWPGGSTIAVGAISWIAWDPNNTEVAYATVSNFTTNTVLKTTNHGQTWTPVMGTGLTALPQIPARSVVVNPADSNQVFVGTDLGVFTSIDGGVNWYRENTGFANVSVNSLRINSTPPYRLFAFTHGRGAWVTPLADSGIVPVVTTASAPGR